MLQFASPPCEPADRLIALGLQLGCLPGQVKPSLAAADQSHVIWRHETT